MVMSLLDVSQSDSGVLRARAASVDLGELIGQVRTQSGPKLRDKSLTLTVVLPAQPIPIEADRDMLLRLLGNLLENAMRHAPSFSSIRLEVIDESEAVELRISDVGAPIPPDDRAQLFDSHVQLEDNAARLRARRGLGLSSCRVIVEAHGGKIWLDESRRDGATFCVRLPRQTLLGF
jgi:signal transduction histidine kinase